MTDERFKCICCHDEHDADKGLYDHQLEGLICPQCQVNIFYSVRYLARAGINRPFSADDVTHSNAKRFIIP